MSRQQVKHRKKEQYPCKNIVQLVALLLEDIFNSLGEKKNLCKGKRCFVPGITQNDQKYMAVRSLPVFCHFLCLKTRKGNSISHRDK